MAFGVHIRSATIWKQKTKLEQTHEKVHVCGQLPHQCGLAGPGLSPSLTETLRCFWNKLPDIINLCDLSQVNN